MLQPSSCRRGALRRAAGLCLLCVLLAEPQVPDAATTQPFSDRTLQGVGVLAVEVDALDRKLAVYGMDATKIRELAQAGLANTGIEIVPYETAVAGPEAALLRIRVMTNHDGHGFYHLSVKFELRRKLPLESAPDAGFVSLAVWTDARNGVMLASEVEKIVPLVTDLLDGFRRDYARHIPASDSNSGTDLNSIPATRS